MKPAIALVDDHVLLRSGLSNLLRELDYPVVFEADNGIDMQEKLKGNAIPQVILMDINMPRMDGFQSTKWLKENLPDIKVLALSMLDDESSIIRMMRSGAKGYILKDTEPQELKAAISAVVEKGYYLTELVTGKLVYAISKDDEDAGEQKSRNNMLTEKETEFLKWCCTELSYKEIADKMGVRPRTIDGYRDDLLEKLELKSRIGLVLYAIKNKLVEL